MIPNFSAMQEDHVLHIRSVTEFFSGIDLPKPQHPHIALLDMGALQVEKLSQFIDVKLSSDLYCVILGKENFLYHTVYWGRYF